MAGSHKRPAAAALRMAGALEDEEMGGSCAGPVKLRAGIGSGKTPPALSMRLT
jgi:hypothetical protein